MRRVVDRASALVPVPRFAFCMVVHGGELAGLFAGTPEAAWSEAADLSSRLHVVYKERPFHTVLSAAMCRATVASAGTRFGVESSCEL